MATTSLIVANLRSVSTYIDSFIAYVYSDSALTIQVGSGSCGAVSDGANGSVQSAPIIITGLTYGATYYVKTGVVTPVTGEVTWSPSQSVVMGTQIAPDGTTYTSTLTATVSGITCVVTPSGAPSNIQSYEAVWALTSTPPANSAAPGWSGVPDDSGVLHFFAGGTPASTLYIFIRAVTTAGLKQGWTSLGSSVIASPMAPSAIQQQLYIYGVDTGTANAYNVTLTPTPTIVDGSVVVVDPLHTNTGASTLVVNGGSPVSITTDGTTALSSGMITVGKAFTVISVGSVWQLQGGAAAAGITQLTGDVLAGPGSGSQVATLKTISGVAGTYTDPTITVDSNGRVTYAASGAQGLYTGNYAQGSTATSGTVTAAFSSALTPGNAIIVVIYNNNTSTVAVSDNQGDTFNSIAAPQGFFNESIVLALNITGGATIMSLTSSVNFGFIAFELKNIVSASALDGTPGYTGGATGGVPTTWTASTTTTNANDYLIGVGLIGGGSGWSTSWGSGYTAEFANTSGDANGKNFYMGDGRASAAGAQSAAWTTPGNFGQQSLYLVALKSTGTSGSAVTSFSGRTGAVAPATGDYTAAQVTGAATQSAVQQESYTYAADTGTANAYAVTLSPAPTLAAGSVVSFKAANANTGASTLAVNGGAATAIRKNGNATALASGDIAAGQIITARYDGTVWQVLTPGTSGGSGPTLETNGTANGSQSLLNLAAGANVTLTDNGTGTVTIASTGSGSGGALSKISETVLSSSAATVTFSSIPTTYRHLVIYISGALGTTSAANVDVWMQFNGDTAAHYTRTYIFNSGTNSPAGAGGGTSGSQQPLFNIPAATASAGASGDGDITIYNYNSSTAYKKAFSRETQWFNAASGPWMAIQGLVWAGTSPVTQITLGPASGSFAAGSIFGLYGIN